MKKPSLASEDTFVSQRRYLHFSWQFSAGSLDFHLNMLAIPKLVVYEC